MTLKISHNHLSLVDRLWKIFLEKFKQWNPPAYSPMSKDKESIWNFTFQNWTLLPRRRLSSFKFLDWVCRGTTPKVFMEAVIIQVVSSFQRRNVIGCSQYFMCIHFEISIAIDKDANDRNNILACAIAVFYKLYLSSQISWKVISKAKFQDFPKKHFSQIFYIWQCVE